MYACIFCVHMHTCVLMYAKPVSADRSEQPRCGPCTQGQQGTTHSTYTERPGPPSAGASRLLGQRTGAKRGFRACAPRHAPPTPWPVARRGAAGPAHGLGRAGLGRAGAAAGRGHGGGGHQQPPEPGTGGWGWAGPVSPHGQSAGR